jgi:hypothetical protein
MRGRVEKPGGCDGVARNISQSSAFTTTKGARMSIVRSGHHADVVPGTAATYLKHMKDLPPSPPRLLPGSEHIEISAAEQRWDVFKDAEKCQFHS